jgi:hypothetical protein
MKQKLMQGEAKIMCLLYFKTVPSSTNNILCLLALNTIQSGKHIPIYGGTYCIYTQGSRIQSKDGHTAFTVFWLQNLEPGGFSYPAKMTTHLRFFKL